MPAHPDTLKDARRLFRKLKGPPRHLERRCCSWEVRDRLHASRRRLPLIHEWEPTTEDLWQDFDDQRELAWDWRDDR